MCIPHRENIISYLSLFFAISVILTGCTGTKQEEKRQSQTGRTAEQILENFTFTQAKGGEKRWELKAKKAEIYEKEGRTVVLEPGVKFYEKGKVTCFLSGKEGRIYSSGDMEVSGDVIVNSSEGDCLRAGSLKWDAKLEKIVSEGWVRHEKGDTVITGEGLESDARLQKVIIKRNVKVFHRFKNEKSIPAYINTSPDK